MLKHENVVELKEAFRRKGKMYLVFEFAEQNLLEVIEQQPKGLPPELVRKFIYQLCKSINYCHEQGVLHRDIKPENLLVNSKGVLKLCDFGFARSIPASGAGLTEYVATRWYRPPELLLSTNDYGKAVDTWAIGCIMGELTDGQPLFPGESEFDQLHVIQKVLSSHATSCLTTEMCALDSRPETLDKRYLGKMSKKAISFMKALLKMDPNERLTAAEALRHPYFEGLHEFEQDKLGRTDLNKDVSKRPGVQSEHLQAEFTSSLLKGPSSDGNVGLGKDFLEKSSSTTTQKPIFNEKGVNKSVETAFQRDSMMRLIDAQNSHRSSSLNKTSYKSGLDSMIQQKFGVSNKFGVGSLTSQSQQVPEAFLKTRYDGSQYSYQLKESIQNKNRIADKLRIEKVNSKQSGGDAAFIDTDDQFSKSPPLILKKTAESNSRKGQLRKGAPYMTSITKESFDFREKSSGKSKIVDLKKSQKPSHYNKTASRGFGGWMDEGENGEGNSNSQSQLPQITLKYNESLKMETRGNHRLEPYQQPHPPRKQNGIVQSYTSSGADGVNDFDIKHSTTTTHMQHYSFGMSNQLWTYKPQLAKR